MRPLDHLASLRSELDTIEEYLGEDLTTAITHCGDWKLHDLAEHMGQIYLWVAVVINEKRTDYTAPPAPRDAAELVTWFHATCSGLLTALEMDPSTPAWTISPPHTVGFWRRRMCLEALVHRWDIEQALGIDNSLDVELAGDGVAEVIDTLAPWYVERGRAKAPTQAVRFAATDTGASWLLGPGEPVATISGTTPDLLLMLWGRLPQEHQAITWEGDRQSAQVVLEGPLTP